MDDILYNFDREYGNIVEYNARDVSWFHIEKLNIFYTALNASLKNLKKELNRLPISKSPLEYREYLFNEVLNEMRQTSIVGIFHLWLRNLQEFLAISGNFDNMKKRKLLNSKSEDILNLFINDEELRSLIPILEKYGYLVNTIKHGIGFSFKKLQHLYPEFFVEPGEYKEELILDGESYDSTIAMPPYVLQNHIDEFYKTAKNFWQNIPEKLVIDFTEKIPKRVIKA